LDLLTRYRGDLVEAMKGLLDGPASPLLDMCRYHLGLADADGAPTQSASGKMIRPALCLAISEGMGGLKPRILPAALAIELVHRTSLIFDDMQDRSTTRNHLPTVWGRWGAAQGINAGLALSCYSRLALRGGPLSPLDEHYVFLAHGLLEHAVVELCEGQYMDLDMARREPTFDEYAMMIRRKTGALMGAACEIGALIGHADAGVQADARIFGEMLGVAFQMRDDIMGVWGDEAGTGKDANDLEERKRGLPVVLALEHCPPEAKIAELIARPPDDDQATADLYVQLDLHGIRTMAERLASGYAFGASQALAKLPLPQPTHEELAALVGFAVERVA
jgi:geranylgeranyl diphosphate synthase type I